MSSISYAASGERSARSFGRSHTWVESAEFGSSGFIGNWTAVMVAFDSLVNFEVIGEISFVDRPKARSPRRTASSHALAFASELIQL
jgi:hypothetical protein